MEIYVGDDYFPAYIRMDGFGYCFSGGKPLFINAVLIAENPVEGKKPVFCIGKVFFLDFLLLLCKNSRKEF